jgi:hypothetical protein
LGRRENFAETCDSAERRGQHRYRRREQQASQADLRYCSTDPNEADGKAAAGHEKLR